MDENKYKKYFLNSNFNKISVFILIFLNISILNSEFFLRNIEK